MLGVLSAGVSGLFCILGDKFINRRPGYAGAAIASTAGNAAATAVYQRQPLDVRFQAELKTSASGTTTCLVPGMGLRLRQRKNGAAMCGKSM